MRVYFSSGLLLTGASNSIVSGVRNGELDEALIFRNNVDALVLLKENAEQELNVPRPFRDATVCAEMEIPDEKTRTKLIDFLREYGDTYNSSSWGQNPSLIGESHGWKDNAEFLIDLGFFSSAYSSQRATVLFSKFGQGLGGNKKLLSGFQNTDELAQRIIDFKSTPMNIPYEMQVSSTEWEKGNSAIHQTSPFLSALTRQEDFLRKLSDKKFLDIIEFMKKEENQGHPITRGIIDNIEFEKFIDRIKIRQDLYKWKERAEKQKRDGKHILIEHLKDIIKLEKIKKGESEDEKSLAYGDEINNALLIHAKKIPEFGTTEIKQCEDYEEEVQTVERIKLPKNTTYKIISHDPDELKVEMKTKGEKAIIYNISIFSDEGQELLVRKVEEAIKKGQEIDLWFINKIFLSKKSSKETRLRLFEQVKKTRIKKADKIESLAEYLYAARLGMDANTTTLKEENEFKAIEKWMKGHPERPFTKGFDHVRNLEKKILEGNPGEIRKLEENKQKLAGKSKKGYGRKGKESGRNRIKGETS